LARQLIKLSIWVFTFSAVLYLATDATAQTRFYQYYQNGMDFLEKGDSLRALDQFQSAISVEFEDKKRKRTYGTRFIKYYPHLQIGKIYYQLGEYQQAYNELELASAYAKDKETSRLLNELEHRGFKRTRRPVVSPKPTPPVTAPDQSEQKTNDEASNNFNETTTDPAEDVEEPDVDMSDFVRQPDNDIIEELSDRQSNDHNEPAEDSAQEIPFLAVGTLLYDPAEFPRIGNRLTLAVLPFSQDGKEAADGGELTNTLITQLLTLRRFTILESNALDKILEEQALWMSGMVDESKAMDIGKLAGADAIIMGYAEDNQNYYKVGAKVFDTVTREALFADEYIKDHQSGQRIEKSIEYLARKLYNAMPLTTGGIFQVFETDDGQEAYIDLGSSAYPELRIGTKLVAYSESDAIHHPKTKELLGVKREFLCELVVTQVQEKMSIAKVTAGTEKDDIFSGARVVIK